MKTDMLTYGERLVLWRRRRDFSQRQAARHWRTTRYRYRAWETDDNGSETGPLPPRAPLGKLRVHEACFIMRRRSRLSVRALARRLSVTPTWITRMERGDAAPDTLIEHWRRPPIAAA